MWVDEVFCPCIEVVVPFSGEVRPVVVDVATRMTICRDDDETFVAHDSPWRVASEPPRFDQNDTYFPVPTVVVPRPGGNTGGYSRDMSKAGAGTDGPRQPSGVEAYVLGREYTVMPIAIDWTKSVEVAAGPVTFVVEARNLSREAIIENEVVQGRSDGIVHDYDVHDGGASLHVLGSDDRVEYLRFDCFDNEPHYHYIRAGEGKNTVVRFDDVAEGDPLEWTVSRVRARLSHMLEHVDAHDLATKVRGATSEVSRGVDELAALLARAAVASGHS